MHVVASWELQKHLLLIQKWLTSIYFQLRGTQSHSIYYTISALFSSQYVASLGMWQEQHREGKSRPLFTLWKNLATYVSRMRTLLLLHFSAASTSFGQHCLGATRAAMCWGHSEQHCLQQDGRMDMVVVQLAFIFLSSNLRMVTPTAMHLNGSKLPNSCFLCCKLNLRSSPNSDKLYKRKKFQPWHGAFSCEDTMK